MQQHKNNGSFYSENSAGTRSERTLQSGSAMTIFSDTMQFEGGEVHYKFRAKSLGTEKNKVMTPIQKGMIGAVGTGIVTNFVRGVVVK